MTMTSIYSVFLQILTQDDTVGPLHLITAGEAQADAVGPELVARSDDAGETRWYCGEMYLQTGMPIYGNVMWPWIYW